MKNIHLSLRYFAAIAICVMASACGNRWESTADDAKIPGIPQAPVGKRGPSAGAGFVTGGHLHGKPGLDLKPGFYLGNDPRWDQLSRFTNGADVHLGISRDAGISMGSRSNLSLEELAAEMKPVKSKRLASILLAKNYSDDALRMKVEKLLFEPGFEQVVITRAHSSGAYLESCRRQAE